MESLSFSELETLVNEIKEKLNLEGRNNNYIASKIATQPGVVVSVSQLNRILRDIDEKEKDTFDKREDTINDLVSILGYENWAEYKKKQHEKILNNIKSAGVYYPIDVDISNKIGETITLGWESKYSKIKIIDGFECKVIESKGMHKQAGDSFFTLGFSLKENPPGLPDIMLDDFGEGYFDMLRNDKDSKFNPDDEYFYL
ncbi:hypothetical protein [Dysgonomonas sp. Marseille-P4361]|uniref:hypothetical protein n=1 Tax=Dysgonomonas sp. Marseille-P4361 TaxID=2161820 RepID=UPI000D54CD15|nr:hypothetical protein [Dysgonomonas sp. Marseille-P4361]